MQHLSSSPRRNGWLRVINYSLFVCVMLSLALGLVLTTPVTHAQPTNANVKMTARSMLQGHFKFGDWLPVEVNLENYGQAVDVQIESEITTRISNSNFKSVYRRDVSLGERANKKLTLYIVPFVETANTSRSVVYDTAITLKANGRKLGEEKINLIPFNPIDYLVASVTPDPNALNGLTNLKIGLGQRTRVVNVSIPLGDIPDNAVGLRSIDAIVLSEVNTETLSNDQRQALREWVESGGQLILMGGNSWGRVRSGFSPSLLPLDITNYSNLGNLSNLVMQNGEPLKDVPNLSKPAAFARGQAVNGSRVLSYLQEGQGTAPVIAERRLGAGRIVATALDLTVSPMLEWSNSPQLWQDLFNYNITPYNQLYSENNPQIKTGADMLSFVSNISELRLPDVTPFFLLGLVYLLLVAPLNYVVLKKVGRLELAWFTIPILGAVFTGVGFWYANLQPPGQVLINQMSVVQVGTDQENAQVRSYAAVFSPEEREYDIRPDSENTGRVLMTPLIRNTGSSVPDADVPRTTVQGEQNRLDSYRIGQWNAQGFSLEANVPARSFQVTADLQFAGDKIIGTIRNTTSTPLRSTLLVLGDTVMRFKEVIEPGETVSVDFTLPAPTAAVRGFCQTATYSGSSSYVNMPSDRISAAMLQDKRDDKVLQNRANFIRKIYESGRYTPLNNQRGLDLIAWMDNNPLPLMVDEVTNQSKSNQVLIARLPVGFETRSGDSRVILPSWSATPEFASTRSGQVAFTHRIDRTDMVCVPPGGTTVQLRLPVEPASFKVNNMTFYVNSYNAQGRFDPNLPDSIELYDFQAKGWKAIQISNSATQAMGGSNFLSAPNPVKNVIEDAARFADPVTGKILLRLGNTAGTGAIFFQHNLEIEGTNK
jgi:hypothetical protein